MDLQDVEPRDVMDMGTRYLPADAYVACIDEVKEGASSSGKHMFTVDFVIAEGREKGQKFKHWFVVESKAGKAVFKHFLRCVSKECKAPNNFNDQMKAAMIGRMVRVGTGLEPSGNFLNTRLVCIGHESEDDEAFRSRYEKALARFGAKQTEPSAPVSAMPKEVAF